MSKEPSNGKIESARGLVISSLIVAAEQLKSGLTPEWFKNSDTRDVIARSVRSYSLPYEVVALVPLALDLLFRDDPPRLATKEIRKKLAAERTRLEKSRQNLQILRDAPRPECLRQTYSVGPIESDGGSRVYAEPEEDPFDDIIGAITRFLDRSSAPVCKPDRHSAEYHLICWLNDMVLTHNPSLSNTEVEAMCDDLFNMVPGQDSNPPRRRDHVSRAKAAKLGATRR